MAAKGRVITGARARFSIDGKKVGYATNVSWTEQIDYQPAECLDNIEIEELVPIGYTVTCNASMIRLESETVKSAGYFPKAGASPEEHLTNILLQKDLVGTVVDSKSGKQLMVLEQIKVASQNVSISARGMAGNDITFSGIRIRDESGG